MDRRLLWWIERFSKPPQLEPLFASAVSSSNPLLLLQLCNFLMTLTIQWPSKKRQFLTSMMASFSPNKRETNVMTIWEGFKRMELYGKINERTFPIKIVTGKLNGKHFGMCAKAVYNTWQKEK
jgi:hypothetical protein